MSREAMVKQMQSWLGAKQGDSIHKNILAIYNTQNPLPRKHKMVVKDDWCAATVTAAAIASGNASLIPGECSCGKMIELMQAMGIFEENDAYVPSKGDIIFYAWNDPKPKEDNTTGHDHVGVVESVDLKKKTINVIEGNNKGVVKRTSILINGKNIRGFGVPKYNDEPEKEVEQQIVSDTTKIDFARVMDAKIAGSYVATASINLRAGAGLTKKIIVLIPQGNLVKCYGYYTSIAGVKWYLVQTTIGDTMYTGFCHSKYLKR